MFQQRLRDLFKTDKDFTAKAGRWITGGTEPNFTELIQIYDYFNVTTDYLLRGKLSNYDLCTKDTKFFASIPKEKASLMSIEKLL